MKTIEQKIKTTDILTASLNNSLFVGIDPHKFMHYVLITSRNQDVIREMEISNNHSDIELLIKEILRIKNKNNFSNIFIGIEGYHGNGEFLVKKLQD
jgi:hypothetical protein